MKHRLLPAAEHRTQPSVRGKPVVGLVVACDDERFIGSLVLSLRSHLDELIVVDDGSRDDTASIARYAGATVLEHGTHRGRIAAVNTGLHHVQQSGPATVLMFDGENEYYEGDVASVLAPIEQPHADVVLGIRSAADQAADAPDNLAGADARSTTYALAAHVVDGLGFDEQGASFEQQMTQLAAREGWHVATVALQRPLKKQRPQRARWERTAFGNLVRLVGEDRPLLFFGASGVLVFFAGCLLGVHVTQIYAETDTLAIGYGLLTVLLCVVGTVLFFAGIILHSTRSMMTELSRSLQLHGVGKEPSSSYIAMPGDEVIIGGGEPSNGGRHQS